MASNWCGSSGEASWALIVDVKSVLLNSAQKKNNVFVEVEIINQQPHPHHQKLETSTGITTVAGHVHAWYQRFFFYLPSCCYSTAKAGACILFRVYAKQKHFSSALLGVAKCNSDDVEQLDDVEFKSTPMVFEIFKGDVSVGKLSAKLTRKHLGHVDSFAMDYRELVMLNKLAEMEKKKMEKKQQPRTNSLLMCFRNSGD